MNGWMDGILSPATSRPAPILLSSLVTTWINEMNRHNCSKGASAAMLFCPVR
jgi:hypothetical protein